MKCSHCGEELGSGDPYDLMASHRFRCNSSVARKLVESEQKSYGHGDYCTC